jgi:hypothetical protein
MSTNYKKASFKCPECNHVFDIDVYDPDNKREKRSPDEKRVLPLTEEELKEFDDKFGDKLKSDPVIKVSLVCDSVKVSTAGGNYWYPCDYKVVEWLLERFNLLDKHSSKI